MCSPFLTIEEMKHFPSLDDLDSLSYGQDLNKWGLCQNSRGELAFRLQSEEWFLQMPLSEIGEHAFNMYGPEYDAENIVVYYEEGRPKVLGRPTICAPNIQLVELCEYQEALTVPFAPQVPYTRQ